MVLTLISGSSLTHLTGSSNFGESRIQIDCYGATRGAANDLGEIVRKNLTHYSGAAGDDTVDVVLPGSPRYRYEKPMDGKGIGRFIHSRDYRVFHHEPAVST